MEQKLHRLFVLMGISLPGTFILVDLLLPGTFVLEEGHLADKD